MAGVELMMEKAVKRIIERFWPELLAKYHLPMWGRIVSEPSPISESAVSTSESPLYAVDVAPLNDQGETDKSLPVLEQVPLPASSVGHGRGCFGFPEKDALVEIGFIRGLPTKPFIRTVLIESRRVPELGSNDLLIQHSDGVYQLAKEEGWHRKSRNIIDDAEDYEERIESLKRSIAGLQQDIRVKNGGKIWLGNENFNTLELLSDFMAIVQSLASDLASHTHLKVQPGNGVSGAPLEAGSISQRGSAIQGKRASLESMVYT